MFRPSQKQEQLLPQSKMFTEQFETSAVTWHALFCFLFFLFLCRREKYLESNLGNGWLCVDFSDVPTVLAIGSSEGHYTSFNMVFGRMLLTTPRGEILELLCDGRPYAFQQDNAPFPKAGVTQDCPIFPITIHKTCSQLTSHT